MSATGKRAVLSGKNVQTFKVTAPSKLDTKEILQLKSASSRSDVRIADQIDEASIIESEFSTGKIFYENTYKLFPDAKMSTKKVETSVEKVLREQFANEVYERTRCMEKCRSICQLIKEKVKELGMSRYKLVVVAHVGENKSQGVQITSRCVWNDNFDDFVTVHFTNSSLFVQATVYALYAE